MSPAMSRVVVGLGVLAVVGILGCWTGSWPHPVGTGGVSDREVLEVTLTTEWPEAHYTVSIAGNENAFWNLTGIRQDGLVWVDAVFVNESPSGSLPVLGAYANFPELEGSLDRCYLAVGVGVDLGVDADLAPGDLAIDSCDFSWFSGACTTPGGCSWMGDLDVFFEPNAAGQVVTATVTISATLGDFREYPGGEPEVWVTIEERP